MQQFAADLTDYFQYAVSRLQDPLYVLYAAAAALLLAIILLVLIIRRKRKKAAHVPEPEDKALKPETSAENLRQTAAGAETRPEPEPEQEAEPAGQAIPGPADKEEPAGVVDRLKSGLGKTRRSLAARIEGVFSEKGKIDSETIEEIEEALVTADIGIETATELIRKIEENSSRISGIEDLKALLKQEIVKVFHNLPSPPASSEKPRVVMVVGVNGVGKTTTIGKLAYRYCLEGRNVLVGASDTFRAAAVEQLKVWADRAGAQIVSHRENADPAAVAYDAVEAACSRDTDIVLIDTAGRLHTKTNLMEQLKKIRRSIAKKLPDAPHEVLLVLDSTTGQNALAQAKMFYEGIGVTALVPTKLDGTAKGGILVAICRSLKLPISYIGVGESIEDLQPFDPESFVEALF